MVRANGRHWAEAGASMWVRWAARGRNPCQESSSEEKRAKPCARVIGMHWFIYSRLAAVIPSNQNIQLTRTYPASINNSWILCAVHQIHVYRLRTAIRHSNAVRRECASRSMDGQRYAMDFPLFRSKRIQLAGMRQLVPTMCIAWEFLRRSPFICYFMAALNVRIYCSRSEANESSR